MRIANRVIDVPTAMQQLGLDVSDEVGEDNALLHCPWPENHTSKEDMKQEFCQSH